MCEGAKDQFLERSGSPCGSAAAVTDIESEVSSVLLAVDIADLAGRIGTGKKVGKLFFHWKKNDMGMRFTGHLRRHLLGDCVVQVLPLASHHVVDVPLAHEDDEDPNSLQR